MHNWMKAWRTEPRGSSCDWEGAECYNFKPDSHALFSVEIWRSLSLSLSLIFYTFLRFPCDLTTFYLFIFASPFHPEDPTNPRSFCPLSNVLNPLVAIYSRSFSICRLQDEFNTRYDNRLVLLLCFRKATTSGGMPSRPSSSKTTPLSRSPSAWRMDPRDTVSVTPIALTIKKTRTFLFSRLHPKERIGTDNDCSE